MPEDVTRRLPPASARQRLVEPDNPHIRVRELEAALHDAQQRNTVLQRRADLAETARVGPVAQPCGLGLRVPAALRRPAHNAA